MNTQSNREDNFRHPVKTATPAAAIIAGVIFILCGMDLYRALYLIIFGALIIPAGKTDEFKHFVIWLCVCIICGILFGTFDYFAHNTGGDEAEFEGKKKQQQEIGELYDKVVEEMNSEKK